MSKLIVFIILGGTFIGASAQSTMSLAECRRLALQNNKQLQISQFAKEIAENTHKVAKAKYLPRVSGLAGYEHFSREISLLNKD